MLKKIEKYIEDENFFLTYGDGLSNVDIKKLDQSITPKTKAIFAVNLLGNPNLYSEIQKIANENGLILIEDNCESLGAEYLGKNGLYLPTGLGITVSEQKYVINKD